MARRVRLRIAFEWKCPNCGTDCFESQVTSSRDSRTASSHSAAGTGPFDSLPEGTAAYAAPNDVTCTQCSREFAVLQD